MTNETKLAATTAPAACAPASPIVKAPSKSAFVLKLLSRAKGATIADIEEPTGWQPHSTRAYLSGLRKKGRSVVREQRKTGETAYRIIDAANSAAGSAVTPVADKPPASSESAEAGGGVGDRASVDAAAATDQVAA